MKLGHIQVLCSHDSITKNIYIYIFKNLLHVCKTELPTPGVTFLQETSPTLH